MEKETLNLLITSVVALVSAILGGLLTIGANEFKGSRDRKVEKIRILRIALFRQLELYSEVIRLSPDVHSSLRDKLIEILRKSGVPEPALPEIETATFVLDGIMKQFLAPNVQYIGSVYEEIVARVAEVDPMLASRISQRFHISRIKTLDEFFGSPLQVPGQLTNSINGLRINLNSSHIRSFIESVEDSILETAKILGSAIHRDAKEKLKKTKLDFFENDDELLQILDPIVKALADDFANSKDSDQ